ncbi:dTDP-4-dehydrorhamnose reductase [Patescibacteria group bacterium]|nr:dTDP-4-dehydrorhamnose reductase [Patescibacteria group bacterium]
MVEKKEKIKLVITGAKGMLGYDLRRVFGADKNYKIFAFDKDTLDVANLQQVKQKIEDIKPDIIINAAAFTAVDDCEKKKYHKKCLEINGKGPGNLAKMAKKTGAVLVHVSTDYVFDGNNQKGYSERARLKPVSRYGKSKAKGEIELKKNCNKFFIVRTSWLYGKNGDNFVKTITGYAKKMPELKVVNDQRGKPTWTYDLALHLKKLVESRKPFGVYHFANEGETTWYDFTKEILRQQKIKTSVKPCATEEFPRPAKRPQNSSLLNTKFTRMQHWKKALSQYLIDVKPKKKKA